jgi:scyllo-inositol 2-dehydrogenase (NADP+)
METIKMTLRAGLIGYGLAGRVFHAPLLQASGIEVVMVATRRKDEVARDLSHAKVVSDPMVVATNPDLDLVVVASPNNTHFPLALAALQAGRSVVIDKPFTHTVAEAEQLMETARAQGRLLSAFHNRRWDSDFLTLRRCMERRDLGEIMSYECHFDRFRPQVSDRWREKPVPGVGLLFDLGPHLIDQALVLFGWPDWLAADLNIQRTGSVVDDDFRILMGKGKLRILLSATQMAAAPGPKFVVHGDRGSFMKQGMDVQENQLKAGMRPGDAGFGVEPTEQAASVTVMHKDIAETTVLPSLPGNYLAYYAGIRNALESGGPAPVSAEDARDSMRILELACRSHREGARISLQCDLWGQ